MREVVFVRMFEYHDMLAVVVSSAVRCCRNNYSVDGQEIEFGEKEKTRPRLVITRCGSQVRLFPSCLDSTSPRLPACVSSGGD